MLLSTKLFIFCCACFSGVFVAFLWKGFETGKRVQRPKVKSVLKGNTQQHLDNWLKTQGLERKYLPEEWLSYKKPKVKSEADFLREKVRILCVIQTKFSSKSTAIKNTWGQSCNQIFYWGDYFDSELPIVKLPPDNSVCAVLSHIAINYENQFDWVFITDDETFAVIENLRYYVAPLDSHKSFYFGHPVQKHYFAPPYNLLDGGIVLSRGTLDTVTSVFNHTTCSTSQNYLFDQDLGYLLHKLSQGNIKVSDTRDSFSRSRFNPFTPEEMIIPGSISVFNPYWRQSVFISNEGHGCCSDSAISFHGISAVHMHLLHYLTHSLSVFRQSLKGIGNKPFTLQVNNQNEKPKNNKIVEGKSYIKMLSRKGPLNQKYKELYMENEI